MALLIRTVINQGGAGTLVIAAASPGNKHKLVGFILSMSSDGTFQFTDGAGILMGAMKIKQDANSVVALSNYPIVETAVNSPLNLVTTSGGGRGVVIYITEP
jgi:hypothetical protein